MIAFHFAAEKGNPQRIRVLEIYKDESAYRDHLQTPHFQRFAQVAQTALLARRIYDAVPIALGAKPLLTTTAPHVRVAELDIAPDQLALYKAAVIEEIEDSIRLEPGVLAIYSMSLPGQPRIDCASSRSTPTKPHTCSTSRRRTSRSTWRLPSP